MHINGRIKKIAAVHDLSGVGRVSLTAVIPILSSMGFQVCPLPTAVLSNHTQYPGLFAFGFDGRNAAYCREVEKNGCTFRYLLQWLSGFITSD